MGEVLAVVNRKGGVGKTTSAVNLAAAWAEAGRRVLLVDLDAQCSASAWLGVNGAEGQTAYELLTAGAALDAVTVEGAGGVFVVPASPWLVGVDRQLAAEPGAETLLRSALRSARRRYDVVLMDCPPSLGLVAVSALVAADAVIVPVAAHVLALSGLAALLDTLARVRERLNSALGVLGVVPCRVDGRTRLAAEVVASLRDRFGPLVTATVVRESVRLAECPSFGKSILAYAPKSAGAEDYRALAAELDARKARKG